ncbi:MAG: hypothetical protein WC600_00665 [Desulfobaccales bacterium]
MSMLKDLLKRPGAGFLLGIGVVILAPIVLPVVARAARPLAKALLHGYFDLVDELKSLAADDEKKPTPVLGAIVATGFEESAAAAGEIAVEEGMADVILEGVVAALV